MSIWRGNTEDVLTDYKNGIPIRVIMKKYKISDCALYARINKLGLNKRSSKNWDEIFKKSVEMYNKGICLTKISSQFGVSIRTLSNYLKSVGMEVKSGTDYMYRTTKNHNYFKDIDNQEKAYFLGLLYADGNIYLKRNKVQITLINEDSYILEKFKECIEYSGKLYSDRGKYTKLMIESKIMVEDLIKIGCIPNKSLVLEFPKNLKPELIRHFIRGFFDGDGCIHLNKSKCRIPSFTSTEKFLMTLKDILSKSDINCSKFYKRYKNRSDSAGSMNIQALSAKKFYDYIYKDATIYLERKMDKFDYNG